MANSYGYVRLSWDDADKPKEYAVGAFMVRRGWDDYVDVAMGRKVCSWLIPAPPEYSWVFASRSGLRAMTGGKCGRGSGRGIATSEPASIVARTCRS